MHIFQPDRYLLQKQLERVAHYVKGRTLDVGAGHFDRYSAVFKSDTYTRMEVHPGPGIDVVGTIYEIPFKDGEFDSLVSTQVFEHLARPALAAREMYRVLRHGGHVIVTVPQMNELHEEPYDFFRYTRFGLTALFEDAGFTIVEIDQRGGYFVTMAQMQIRYAIDRYSLYQRPRLGRLFGKWAALYGRYALWRDRTTSVAARKHALGWCVVLKKK